ncbi:hypothetical protein DFH09DRAFT_1361371 [Mycena vulgaris]|nr:hypothetical protein DFH09DRAFT_1361371 [Mycena vulgaris]
MSGMTNCTPATFSWVYGATTDSQPVDLRLIITSDVPGDSHLDQLITPEPIDPLAHSFTWPSVNTISGGYQIAAISDMTQFLILSNSFKVVNSDITSCRSTSTPVSVPGASSVSHIALLSASSPSGASQSQSQSQGQPPAQPQANDSKVNHGAIAGGVVGGLFMLIATISVIRCQYHTRTRIATTPAEISRLL